MVKTLGQDGWSRHLVKTLTRDNWSRWVIDTLNEDGWSRHLVKMGGQDTILVKTKFWLRYYFGQGTDNFVKKTILVNNVRYRGLHVNFFS